MALKYDSLIGLEFTHGSRDCYELVRDFYRDNFSLELSNYARPDGWWDNGQNLYMENFWKEGFRPFDGPPIEWQPADLLLMAIRSPVANHAAIFLGEGKILHHFYGRRSCVESYGGVWRRTTVAHIRHKDLVLPAEEIQKVDLMTLIPPGLRRQLERGTRT